MLTRHRMFGPLLFALVLAFVAPPLRADLPGAPFADGHITAPTGQIPVAYPPGLGTTTVRAHPCAVGIMDALEEESTYVQWEMELYVTNSLGAGGFPYVEYDWGGTVATTDMLGYWAHKANGIGILQGAYGIQADNSYISHLDMDCWAHRLPNGQEMTASPVRGYLEWSTVRSP